MELDFEERALKWIGIALVGLLVFAGIGAMVESTIKSWERVEIARAKACESNDANTRGSGGEK